MKVVQFDNLNFFVPCIHIVSISCHGINIFALVFFFQQALAAEGRVIGSSEESRSAQEIPCPLPCPPVPCPLPCPPGMEHGIQESANENQATVELIVPGQ